MSSHVSPPLQALLELFDAELEKVKFPGVDGDALQQTAEKVDEAAAEVARAEEALEAARMQRSEADEALLGLAQRALAYAKVYAEDQPELAAKLDALALPRSPRKPRAEAKPEGELATPPRRRRRTAERTENALLFDGDVAGAVTRVE